MLSLFRLLFVLLTVSPLAALAATDNPVKPATPVTTPAPANKSAQPATPVPAAPPTAAPAFLDVVTFKFHDDSENHKVVVTTGPGLLRVDEPDDGYSVIYHEQTDSYTGLEHRNYTYWEFSWPEVRAAVEVSKRGEARIEELNAEGASSDLTSPVTNASSLSPTTTDTSTSSVPDNTGYVWKPTTDHKKIAGLDCVRWTGDTVSGESVEAWCYAGALPTVCTALDRLRKINDPLALVPMRTIVPSLIFPVYDGLVKGGVTPVEITWGGNLEKSNFTLVGTQSRDGTLALFTIPKLYNKTTLASMDGMYIKKDQTP